MPLTPDLSMLPDADLIRELRKRDYRCVHRDRIRIAAAQTSLSKHHIYAVLPERVTQERLIRADLGRNLAHFLADHLPVEELPGEHHIEYRMTTTIIGPKVSADDPDYFLQYRPLP